MVCEEEDFQPMQYGYRLSPDVSEQRIIGMLREVEEDLHKRTRMKLSEERYPHEVNMNKLLITQH